MESPLLFFVLLIGTIVSLIFVMRNNGIHDLDFTGTTFSSGGNTNTINVSPAVTSYKFRIRNASAYNEIATIGVYNISGSVDPTGITILSNGPSVYNASVNTSNAYVGTFTGNVSADTVYYVQFASAVTSFNIVAND